MGFRMTVIKTARAVLWIGMAVAVPGLLAGCQPSQAVMSQRMLDHLALVDFTGLAPAVPIEGLDVSAALPRAWTLLPTQRGGLYTHSQWRSPSHATAVGVVHVHLPLPMSAQTLVWLAKTQYSQAHAAAPGPKDADTDEHAGGGPGRLLREWTDGVGREWVEAENDRYHATGYVVTCGFDAWVVYSGYRRHAVLSPVEVQLAGRSMDSVVPLPLAAKASFAKRP